MIIKNLIPKEFCQFFTHVLLRNVDLNETNQDGQVKDSLTMMSHEVMFETLHERLWPKIESIVGKKLIPTYAYARLYQNGNVLDKHIDRESCEISVTIQLGRSHHYSYPIYLEGQRVDLAEGDGILYNGTEQEHWRDACHGPDGYYSGHVFLHFVDAEGQHQEHAGDKQKRKVYSYLKNRTHLMESK